MTYTKAGQILIRMMEELPFYSNETQALALAVIALNDKAKLEKEHDQTSTDATG
jgi:hypothetical protein